jgi:hypothetical protein
MVRGMSFSCEKEAKTEEAIDIKKLRDLTGIIG